MKNIFLISIILSLNVFAYQQQQQLQEQVQENIQEEQSEELEENIEQASTSQELTKPQEPNLQQNQPDQVANKNCDESIAPKEKNGFFKSLINTIVDLFKSNKTKSTETSKTEETLKTKKHIRVCPTCGRRADNCYTDKVRIFFGEILTCGCSLCGGEYEPIFENEK